MIEIPLEGGFSRKRQDILNPGFTVNCQWILSGAEYTEFMGFFVSELRYGLEDFHVDLITDVGVPTTHNCRTVGGLPKLTRQSGDTYWVSATLQVDGNFTVTDLISYVGSGEIEDDIEWVFDKDESNIMNFGNNVSWERNENRTIAFWFKTPTDGPRVVMAKEGTDQPSAGLNRPGYYIMISNGFVVLRIQGDIDDSNGTIIASPSLGLDDDVMHSVVLTYTGTSTAAGWTMVVDGSSVTKTVPLDNLSESIVNSGSFVIGNNDDFAIGGFDGLIKNVAQWNTALSPFQVAIFNAAGPDGDISGLNPVFWVKLDGTDTTGTGGIDDHGSGNKNGTANFSPEGTIIDSGGSIHFPNINTLMRLFVKAGDKVRILNSKGVHPTGPTPLNLDGVYDVAAVSLGVITLDNPAAVNSDWITLASLGPGVAYGNQFEGNVLSTVTRVPT